ncbi:haloacid dehalogenase-like hydrolase, partial [Ostertagia ostertagi]
EFGICAEDADAIVVRAVPEASTGQTAPVCDLQKLFRELRSLGCKLALCTADSRAATEQQMRLLGIASLLDDVVCGNDHGIIPKPSPHCAIQICKRLEVPLHQAIMVGDTIADLKMGRVAGLRASVGVLTGVGNRDTLKEYSDYFVSINFLGKLFILCDDLDNVSELPLLIATKINQNTKRG